jgi:hypothetical protein
MRKKTGNITRLELYKLLFLLGTKSIKKDKNRNLVGLLIFFDSTHVQPGQQNCKFLFITFVSFYTPKLLLQIE